MTGFDWLIFATFLVGGWLAGSVPFALLIGLARGVDVREVGSGNVGATNLGRALGFKYLLLCFALAALKGFGPTLGFGLTMGWIGTRSLALEPLSAAAWLAVAAAPLLGHAFSPWIKFRGGKGIATGLGAVLGIFPALAIPGLGSLVVFLAVFAIWRYVSLASVLAAAALPLWVWYFFSLSATRLAERGADQQLERFETKPTVYLVAAMALAAFAIWKHRDNIQRLVDGTEPKVGSRGKHRS